MVEGPFVSELFNLKRHIGRLRETKRDMPSPTSLHQNKPWDGVGLIFGGRFRVCFTDRTALGLLFPGTRFILMNNPESPIPLN